MMFVIGEVAEPLDATVQLIEDIVQRQISELIFLRLFWSHSVLIRSAASVNLHTTS